MELIYNTLQAYDTAILLMLIACCFVLIILKIITLTKIRSINTRINKFMRASDTENTNSIESMLIEYLNKVDSVSADYSKLSANIETIFSRLETCVQKIGIVRYNPFENVGGDLCFALALLDENNNGTLINSIYSREGCYTYAKKISNGKCETHKLSSEEEQAIQAAINNRQ